MRGKPPVMYLLEIGTGITPAHAGKTRTHEEVYIMTRDHPRACGENLHKFDGLNLCIGSPPRMRGKLSPETQMNEPQRITPAHAGKTQSVPRKG